MAGLTESVRHAIINRIYRGGAAGSVPQATELALVTAVSAGMAAGGAIANEIALTGYSRVSVGSLIDAPSAGVADNQLIIFGTADQGQGSVVASHIVALDASGDVVDVIQFTNAGRTAAAPLTIDTSSNAQTIRVPAAALQISVASATGL